MKKILAISILLSCLLIVLSILPVSAQDFNRLKQAILTGVDRTVTRINDIERQINANPAISDTTKQIVINGLDNVKNYLVSYKSQVETATTLDELKTINQGVRQYLIDNQDVIRENITKAIKDIAEEASTKAEEFKQEVELVLKQLKVTCPAQKDTISQIETQLQQLEDETNVLKQAIQSSDTVTIKQEISKIAYLTQGIANNLNQIEASCSALHVTP